MIGEKYISLATSGAVLGAVGAVPVPPGTDAGQMSALELFSELAEALGLQKAGVYTPWATRRGDVEWEEIVRPETNIVLFGLTDSAISAATDITFGAPIPFVGVVTAEPRTETEIAQMWAGTAYRAYETQALYSQRDAKEPPTPLYLHWGERVDLAELPQNASGIEPRARAVSGNLVYAVQIPAQDSTERAAPAMPFTVTLTPGLAPAPAEAPRATAPAAAAPASTPSGRPNYAVAVAAGLGALGLGLILMNEWRKD